MKKYIFFLLLLSFGYSILEKESFPLGIYNFYYKNKQYLTYENDIVKIAFSEKIEYNTFFRIKKSQDNNNFYHIENLDGTLNLCGVSELKFSSDKNSKNLEWSFIEKNNNKYIIQNKNGCYITLKRNNLLCQNKKDNAIQFNITILYEEVNNTEEEIKLIENEPIDVFIKYIDLSDRTLVRKGIPQIFKDQENDELKYNVRSIIKNIPWVRKIYIVMPNEKIRFFKDYELIEDRIVYVKDIDLIGFDSSNVYIFHYNAWNLKKFGMSENYILMDDDFFIGKPLKKTDFFCVKDGKVVPLIITNRFYSVGENRVKYKIKNFKKKMIEAPSQSHFHYDYSKEITYLLDFEIFKNKKLIVPAVTHNAIPCNMEETKELYDIVKESEFRVPTLESLFREDDALEFHALYQGYVFNKYKRKVHNLPPGYIDADLVLEKSFNYSLFCINTDSGKYSSLSRDKTKIAMEYLFPEPTPYELDHSILRLTSNISHHTTPLFIVGSHVRKTTRQLECLLATEGTCGIELDVQRILDDPETLMRETQQVIRQVVDEHLTPVVYTSRQEIRLEDANQRQHLGQQVSDFLVDIVRQLSYTPSYLVAKGGITSHDILTHGLNIKSARVLGQIVNSVPCIMTKDFPYIIFPGNVGNEESLKEVYLKLKG